MLVIASTAGATLHFDYLVQQNGEIDASVCGASKVADVIDPVTGQVPCFLGSGNTPKDVLVYTSPDSGNGHDQGFYLRAIG